jgi:hypothetical protein
MVLSPTSARLSSSHHLLAPICHFGFAEKKTHMPVALNASLQRTGQSFTRRFFRLASEFFEQPANKPQHCARVCPSFAKK